MSGSNPDNRRHPESTFEARYPYNQATITRSGHEFHINDTPDNESLRIAHTKGSYVEINKDGKTTLNSVGKAYYYFCDGFTTSVDGHYDLKVKGVMNVNVDGSIEDTTAGNRYINSKGNMVVGVGSSLNETVVGDKYENVGGVHSVTVDGSRFTTIKGDTVTQITGSKNDVLESNWSVSSGQNIEILSNGDIRISCKNFIIDAEMITLLAASGPIVISAQSLLADIDTTTRISSGNDTTIQSATTTIQSSSSVDINGSPVKINGTTQVGD